MCTPNLHVRLSPRPQIWWWYLEVGYLKREGPVMMLEDLQEDAQGAELAVLTHDTVS